ncbi:MAG: hypothetical protein H0U66_15295 [Gemmatimonadaceae bacterium]|nr:hypothetical protein [Gemmatimonadaceae bacterium]
MSNNNLATYLKDHFAGSDGALAVLDHIEREHGNGAAGAMARMLRPQFQSERQVLEALLAGLNDESSMPRRVFGWLSEKGLELKLRLDDSSHGPLHLLEAVEMLALGVHGKRGLWTALDASRAAIPALGNVDYAHLTKQAEEQRTLIESVRMSAAQSAFSPQA